MKNVFKTPKHAMLAGILLIAVTAVAWQTNDDNGEKDSINKGDTSADTTTPKKFGNDKDEFRIRDLDNNLKDLDIQLKGLDIQLKDLDIDLFKELKRAFEGIDFEQIDIELNDIDKEKIKKEIRNAIKEADFDKIKIEVDKCLKDAEIELKKVNTEKVRKEIQALKLSLNSGELKAQMDAAMQKAKLEIEKAKKELQQLKKFTDELQNDGLIDKKKGYSIEWKSGGELYINGDKQTKSVADKYREYYRKDGYKINVHKNSN